MLLDSNSLIYGANGENPNLDAILDCTDLAASSVTRIETLGFFRLSEIERTWLETAFARLRILNLDDAVAERAMRCAKNARWVLRTRSSPPPPLCMIFRW